MAMLKRRTLLAKRLPLPMVRHCGALVLLAVSVGCAQLREIPMEPVVTSRFVDERGILAGTDGLTKFRESVRSAVAQTAANSDPAEPTTGDATTQPAAAPRIAVLALSGGGADGAYGAGFLSAWTAHGSRPEFRIVTGISTGALIGSFAFVGPSYDARLRQAYTANSDEDFLRIKPLIAGLLSDALGDDQLLRELIAYYIDRELIDAVAAEHRRGRRFYVGTTNLDGDQLVIWDMGAIAASDRPDRVELYQSVVRASSSIPALFGPVYFPFTSDGRTYSQMHVDGGLKAQVFAIEPLRELVAALDEQPPPRPAVDLYLIRNGKRQSDLLAVQPRVFVIGRRALASLIYSQTTGDIFRIATIAKQLGVNFHLTFVPDSHPNATADFNPQAMRELYDLGHAAFAHGSPWVQQVD